MVMPLNDEYVWGMLHCIDKIDTLGYEIYQKLENLVKECFPKKYFIDPTIDRPFQVMLFLVGRADFSDSECLESFHRYAIGYISDSDSYAKNNENFEELYRAFVRNDSVTIAQQANFIIDAKMVTDTYSDGYRTVLDYPVFSIREKEMNPFLYLALFPSRDLSIHKLMAWNSKELSVEIVISQYIKAFLNKNVYPPNAKPTNEAIQSLLTQLNKCLKILKCSTKGEPSDEWIRHHYHERLTEEEYWDIIDSKGVKWFVNNASTAIIIQVFAQKNWLNDDFIQAVCETDDMVLFFLAVHSRETTKQHLDFLYEKTNGSSLQKYVLFNSSCSEEILMDTIEKSLADDDGDNNILSAKIIAYPHGDFPYDIFLSALSDESFHYKKMLLLNNNIPDFLKIMVV